MGEDAPYPTLVATQHQAAGFGGFRSFAAAVAKARLAGSWALCSTAKENFRDLMRPLAWADNARMKMWFPRRSDGSATGQDDRALRIEKVDILDSERVRSPAAMRVKAMPLAKGSNGTATLAILPSRSVENERVS
jgi:hypothetical protein